MGKSLANKKRSDALKEIEEDEDLARQNGAACLMDDSRVPKTTTGSKAKQVDLKQSADESFGKSDKKA